MIYLTVAWHCGRANGVPHLAVPVSHLSWPDAFALVGMLMSLPILMWVMGRYM